MNFIWQEVRSALSKLRRKPAFTVFSVLILGLSIGVNTSIFSAVNAVLLRPLPYGNPDQLVMLYERNLKGDKTKEPVSPANYTDWTQQAGSFEQIGASRSSTFNLTGSGEPESLTGYLLSANFFQMLGTPALIGRTFQPGEPEGTFPVVLSYRLWQRRFGGQESIVGQAITLNGRVYTVIGVMPRDFQYPNLDTELWIILRMTPQLQANRDAKLLRVVGRLKPGVTLAQGQAEINFVAARLAEAHPASNTGWDVQVIPLHKEFVGDVSLYMFLLLGAAGLVLLIACINITSLFLVRAASRQKEIAIRASLGASRKRIIGSLLLEGGLVALFGGIVGLLLAWRGREALVSFFPQTISNLQIPRVASLPLDGRVFAFMLLLCAITTLVFGLLPAVHSSNPDLQSFMKEGVKGSSGGFTGRRFRNYLIVSEVALAFALMIGAGLLIKSFRQIRQVNLGFDYDRLLTLRVQLPAYKYKEDYQRIGFYNQVLQRIGSLPGVESAGLSNYLPLSGWYNVLPFVIEGHPPLPAGQEPEVDHRVISPGFFSAMKIPLIKGRYFTDADNETGTQVIIINETMARRYWPGEDPVGRRIKLTGEHKDDWRLIVGVVGDVKHFGADTEAKPEMYRPYLQEPQPLIGLVVRTSGEPTSIAPAVRNEVLAVDRDQPVSHILTMGDLVAESLAPRQVSMVLLTILGGVALLLALLGIYGVLSYSIEQRTQEIGIRTALGAQQMDVMKLILGQSLRLIVIGVFVGVLGAIGIIRVFSSLLFGVSATDPLTFVVVTAVLLITALLASYLPARRASQLDPLRALREQ
ncbi:MAG: ABC transporter permease [Acidobacteriota bacterium]